MDSSELISLIISPFKTIFFFHKKKLAFFLTAIVVFTLVLFPYSDLTSFSKDKINQALKPSGSSVDYSNISFNLSPFGIQTSGFEARSRSLKKPLKVDNITVRPNLISLLKLQPGGSAVFTGLFSGSADISFSLNGKTEENTQKFGSSLEIHNISLADVLSFQDLPYKLKGLLNGELQIQGEDSFREQPKGFFKFNMKKVVIPQTISIPNFGDIPLPKKVIWDNSNLFGKISNGKILITEGTLGTKKAPMNGRYKGSMNCSFNKSGPTCTTYDFKIELELNAEFQRKLAADLKPLINPRNVNIISLPQGGAKYLFSIQGNLRNRSQAPRFSHINSFE